MRIWSIFRKTKRIVGIEKPSRFSDFFLHASEEEKEKVFREAAFKANEEQREILKRAQFKVKAS